MIKEHKMEETLSMNALIQAIYAIRFTLKHHTELANSGSTDLDEDAIGELGETLMMLTVAETELARAYENGRPTISTQTLPDYEGLCAGFVFP